MAKDIEQLLDKLHIAFTEDITYFPCRGNLPKTTFPDYVISSYGHQRHPMIWMATSNRTFSDQAKSLSLALEEYSGKSFPEQDYVCNLYVRLEDRVGNKDGDCYWYKLNKE